MKTFIRVLVTIFWLLAGAAQVSFSVSCIRKLGPLSSPLESSIYIYDKKTKIHSTLIEAAEFVDGFQTKFRRLPTLNEYYKYSNSMKDRMPEFIIEGDLPPDLKFAAFATVPSNEYYLSYMTDNNEEFFYYTSWNKKSTAEESPPLRYGNFFVLILYIAWFFGGFAVIFLALNAFYRKKGYFRI